MSGTYYTRLSHIRMENLKFSSAGGELICLATPPAMTEI